MFDAEAFDYWKAGDKEGFICSRMKGKTAAGLTPTRSVASRWYNLMSAINDTRDDIWIHREKDQLWWTRSNSDDAVFERMTEPLEDKREIVICHKPCGPWRNASRNGNPLPWNSLHPRAKEFLFTEGTLQTLREDNAAYALALIEGEALDSWHSRTDWKAKADKSGKSAGRVFNPRQLAVARMAMTARGTVDAANGQVVERRVKNKELLIPLPQLEVYIDRLIDEQGGFCALTGIPLQFDRTAEDNQLLCSLDRIDSSKHYEFGNLQVVCRFVNFWKSDMPNAEFKRLMDLVQNTEI
ncbi:hypothetical protein V1T76_17400 [Roseibium sp. FZY0029]|uniref:hypothetical protein n=1 Tax=Roseibium sp. FZY0029 TaxID=3116647 RepID=UPI002EABC4F9|nr:hypothetical protein [Roseibium sp. FZY0029]